MSRRIADPTRVLLVGSLVLLAATLGGIGTVTSEPAAPVGSTVEDPGDDEVDVTVTGKTMTRTETGFVESRTGKVFHVDPMRGVDKISVELKGPKDADFDLYLTVDGRVPTSTDNDFESEGRGSKESIALAADQVATEVGILVKSYSGSGNFTLKITQAGVDEGVTRTTSTTVTTKTTKTTTSTTTTTTTTTSTPTPKTTTTTTKTTATPTTTTTTTATTTSTATSTTTTTAGGTTTTTTGGSGPGFGLVAAVGAFLLLTLSLRSRADE